MTASTGRSAGLVAGRERAFTMIELLVAFVLIGIVCAVAASSIIRGFSGAANTATSASGRAKAAEVADRLGNDVRAARSVGRDGARIADVADLVRAVQTDGVLYDIDGNVLDWRDITVAEPNRITFQSDVVDEASGSQSLPECVTWQVDSSAQGWKVQRTTRAYATGCANGGGTVLEDDAMTPPTTALPAPGTSGTPALFAYVLAQRVGQGCGPSTLSRTLSSDERNRVVGIRIDFSGLVVHREDASRTALRDEISMRSRSSADYQLALGCDEG
jgi:type II secretory pathway pseudopilin PulG